jgi:uncharacterized protein (DUF1015 family)
VPEIQPFAGIRYRVPDDDLPRVLAPPYDVISPAEQQALYGRDPRNIVRVILNRATAGLAYQEAGETYRGWLAEGLLAPDPDPALYVLEQGFALGEKKVRRYGLLARFRAEDPSKGVVLPHEQTRSGPREDRYRVLMATRANFSPIFLLFPDSGRFSARVAIVIGSPAIAAFSDDAGVRHRLWRITDQDSIEAFRESLHSVKAYIADGHHRYATALRYRDEVGPEGAWTYGYFTPLDAPGLTVLPYHRLLAVGPSLEGLRKALQDVFLVNLVSGTAAAARDTAHSTMPYAFGFSLSGDGSLVAEALPEAEDLLPPDTPPSLRVLDGYFLHQAILPRLGVPDEALSYVHDVAEAAQSLAQGRNRLAVLMRPTPVRQVVDVADAGESMPAKSTFFHPKLPSGLVIHPLVV